MTEDIFIYYINLPAGVHEFVAKGLNDYSIYIDQSLSFEDRRKAYIHALQHIKNNDFDKDNADNIEYDAHKRSFNS